MKGYKLVAEHPNHFELSHPQDGTFKISKAQLSPGGMKKVRALPKHMADGGDAPVPSLVDQDSATDMMGGDSPAALQDKMRIAANPGTPINVRTDAPLSVATPDQAPDALPVGQQVYPTPTGMAPNVGGANPNTQQPTFGTQSGGAPTNFDPFAGVEAGYNKAYGETAAGIKAGAAAQQRYADEAAKAQQDLVTGLQTAKQSYDQHYQALDQQNQELTNAVMNTKIDPNRVWSQASTGNKIAAGIGILLSGIGSGLTGQQNMAMQVIQKTIDRDVEAQKAELGKKETLLSMNMRKYGNLNAAYQATTAQLYAVAKGQIGAAAAKMGGGMAGAQAQQAMGQLDMGMAQRQQGLAMLRMKMQFAGGGDGPGQNPYLMNQLFPGQVVNVPGAGLKLAATPDDAKKVKDAQESAIRLKAQIAKMKDFNQNVAGTTGTIPGTSNNSLAGAMQQETIPLIQEFNGLTRLSDTDKGIDENMIMNPGTIRSEAFNKVMDNLSKSIDQRLDGVYSQRLLNHNPGAARAKVQGIQ